jgi:hypothetical protein
MTVYVLGAERYWVFPFSQSSLLVPVQTFAHFNAKNVNLIDSEQLLLTHNLYFLLVNCHL